MYMYMCVCVCVCVCVCIWRTRDKCSKEKPASTDTTANKLPTSFQNLSVYLYPLHYFAK